MVDGGGRNFLFCDSIRRSLPKHIDVECVLGNLTLTEGKSFDLIVINQREIGWSIRELLQAFMVAADHLANNNRSVILINGVLPNVQNHRNESTWNGKEVFKIIFYVRMLEGFDASLINVDDGLLIARKRRNPDVLSRHDFDQYGHDYAEFKRRMDKVISLLSFAEFHRWLSVNE